MRGDGEVFQGGPGGRGATAIPGGEAGFEYRDGHCVTRLTVPNGPHRLLRLLACSRADRAGAPDARQPMGAPSSHLLASAAGAVQTPGYVTVPAASRRRLSQGSRSRRGQLHHRGSSPVVFRSLHVEASPVPRSSDGGLCLSQADPANARSEPTCSPAKRKLVVLLPATTGWGCVILHCTPSDRGGNLTGSGLRGETYPQRHPQRDLGLRVIVLYSESRVFLFVASTLGLLGMHGVRSGLEASSPEDQSNIQEGRSDWNFR